MESPEFETLSVAISKFNVRLSNAPLKGTVTGVRQKPFLFQHLTFARSYECERISRVSSLLLFLGLIRGDTQCI